MSEFTRKVIEIIKAIPEGQVATYGQVAGLAGHPRAPRQVAGMLKRYAHKFDLPWHRVISSKGCISITEPRGRQEQIHRLRDEGVEVATDGSVDLNQYGWKVERFDV